MKSFLVTTRNNVLAHIFPAQRLIRYLSRKKLLPKAFWARIQPIGSFDLKLPDGNSIMYSSDASDQLARSIVWTDFADWESSSVQIFCHLAKTAACVLDIGAYTGIYSLMACAANRQAVVALFEPNPELYRSIETNVRANGFESRVKIYTLALSDESGMLKFILAEDRTASQLSTAYDGSRRVHKIIDVEVRPLDEIFDQRVDLIKIDAENNEIQVLKGMIKTLRKYTPTIIVECSSHENFTAAKNLLLPLGYKAFYYVGKRGLYDTLGYFQTEPTCSNYLMLADSESIKLMRKYIVDPVAPI